MLEAEHITFSYRNRTPVLKDVSFRLGRGECMCLLGPNGVGKTTLLRCLLNGQKPSSGKITLDSQEIYRLSARERAVRLAYVPQATGLTFPYPAEEVVLMGRVAHMRLGAAVSAKDREIAREAMEHLGILELVGKNFQILSGGQRQMVLVARAIAQQAGYLIMDEPTAALDYSNQVRILDTIARLTEDGYGILMTTHYPDHAFLACSRAMLMRGGRITAFGTPEEVVTGEKLTELYQVPVCVTEAVVNNQAEQTTQMVCVPVISRKLSKNDM